MLKALIISDKPFIEEALKSYKPYADAVKFDTAAIKKEGYDIYIGQDSEISFENGEISIVRIINQLDNMMARFNDSIGYKGLHLTVSTKTLAFGEGCIELTSIEMQLFKALMDGKNGASKDYLLNCVLGYNSDVETKALENHIYKLRKKLECITTKVGIVKTENGYALT